MSSCARPSVPRVLGILQRLEGRRLARMVAGAVPVLTTTVVWRAAGARCAGLRGSGERKYGARGDAGNDAFPSQKGSGPPGPGPISAFFLSLLAHSPRCAARPPLARCCSSRASPPAERRASTARAALPASSHTRWRRRHCQMREGRPGLARHLRNSRRQRRHPALTLTARRAETHDAQSCTSTVYQALPRSGM